MVINIKIFNIRQADIFIKSGAIPIGCGFGRKYKTFIEFKEDIKFEELMKKWLAKNFS